MKGAVMICCHCYEEIDAAATQCGACEKEPFLKGKYRLEKLVGTGASARTYRAVRLDDQKTVAIKELLFHRIEVLKTHELFEREARVLSQLEHPQIPKFIETFEVEEGRSLCFYIVQEFVDGQTIGETMAGKRFGERDALHFLKALAEPLGYLHGLPVPVVHRDLKPGNIMRRRRGNQVMLIDFGAVRDVLKPRSGSDTVVGTFGYMAPEQFEGDATPASDVFGLGATTVALLSNQDFSSTGEMLRHLGWLSISNEFRSLLTSMVEHDPGDRPDIIRVRAEVERLLEQKPVMPVPVPRRLRTSLMVEEPKSIASIQNDSSTIRLVITILLLSFLMILKCSGG